jgi:hypothetical protein
VQPATIPTELSEAVSKRNEQGLRRFLGHRKGATLVRLAFF